MCIILGMYCNTEPDTTQTPINSLFPEGLGFDFKSVIVTCIIVISFMSIFSAIALAD